MTAREAAKPFSSALPSAPASTADKNKELASLSLIAEVITGPWNRPCWAGLSMSVVTAARW
jgi:hypothetical protein